MTNPGLFHAGPWLLSAYNTVVQSRLEYRVELVLQLAKGHVEKALLIGKSGLFSVI